MAVKSSTAGIALLVVSVLAVAAAGGVVLYKAENCDDPNGIIGVYHLESYTQGGMEADGEWHWYTTGDGTYDGEIISIYYYKDNFVKGACYLGGEKYDIAGYYDPDTFTFGYASYYNYSPEGSSDVVDLLYGSIRDGVMTLTGYTASAKSATSAYAFNFVFLKDGAHYPEIPYVPLNIDATSKSIIKAHMEGTALKDTEEQTSLSDAYKYKTIECVDGVYKMSIVHNDETIYASAVSVYRNFWDRTEILKCIYIDADGTMQSEWLHLTNASLDYIIRGSSTEPLESTTIFFKQLTLNIPAGASGHSDYTFFDAAKTEFKNYSWNVTYTPSTEIQSQPYYSLACLAKSSTGFQYILCIWPDTNLITFKLMYEVDGVKYFGECLGYKCDDNHFHSFGFEFSDKGEVIVVKSLVAIR